jgi:UDP-N-acetylglucosamine 4,6-dehydratase
MISSEDSRRTLRRADRYIVLPTFAIWGGFTEPAGEQVEDGFAYTSDKNDLWLSQVQLAAMLAELGL